MGKNVSKLRADHSEPSQLIPSPSSFTPFLQTPNSAPGISSSHLHTLQSPRGSPWLMLFLPPAKPFSVPHQRATLIVLALGHWVSSGKLSGHLPSNVAHLTSLCSERYLRVTFHIWTEALITCYYHSWSV